MLAGVAAVIESMFLLFFAQRLPAMGQHTPLIGMLTLLDIVFRVSISFSNSYSSTLTPPLTPPPPPPTDTFPLYTLFTLPSARDLSLPS